MAVSNSNTVWLGYRQQLYATYSWAVLTWGEPPYRKEEGASRSASDGGTEHGGERRGTVGGSHSAGLGLAPKPAATP